MSGRPVRTLVVWCPDWPVVAAGRPGAEPVAVVAANRVVAASEAARAEGVEEGLRRRQAETRCPLLVVVASDPGRDQRAFEPVVAAVESFTPAVEVVAPGLCAFATRGPSRYFGGDAALAASVAARVDGVLAAGGARCRVGVADGLFAAERAARQGTIVPAGGSAGFLAPFPVATLGDEGVADLLRRLGIPTLGRLAELPAPAVLARFGPAGAAASRLARGLDERPLAARTPPPDLAVAAVLDPPAERVEAAAFVARGLAERLSQQLADRGLAATRVLVEAETEHGERMCRLWRHDGGLTPAALAERVRWQLDGWTTTGGLSLIRLAPDEVRPDDGRQLGFWGGDRAAAERAGRSLARVQGILGPEAVVTAVLDGGRGPAERARLVTWGESRPDGGRTATGPPWPGRVPPPAPASVHPAPPPAEMVDAAGAPVGVTGRGAPTAPPARLSVAGRPWADVTGWAGPWPYDERWWAGAGRRGPNAVAARSQRGPDAVTAGKPAARSRRARWQVTTTAGDAHLLSVEAGRWSVEATYD